MSTPASRSVRARTIRQILEKARYLITPREFWTQGSYTRYLPHYQRDGRPEQTTAYCSIGALREATRIVTGKVDPILDPTYMPAKTYLGNAIRPGYGIAADILTWNDRRARDHEEVLAAFDRAIAKAAADEARAV